VFAVCVALVFTWSVFVFLKKLPHWLLFLSAWDTLGVFAYTQAAALLESVILLLALTVLSAIVPARLLRDGFVAKGSAILLITTAWLVAEHLGAIYIFVNMQRMLIWLVLYVISIGWAYVVVVRYQWVRAALLSLADRLMVLLYLYLPLSIVSVIVILLRHF
jgi:hypothetical protein